MKLKWLEKLGGEIDTSEWLSGRRAAERMLMCRRVHRATCRCVRPPRACWGFL